jgi:hypothetical protein
MEWKDVRDLSVLRDECVRHIPRGEYSGVGRRRYTHRHTRYEGWYLFLPRILYCVDHSVGRKQGQMEGKKEGSKEMWVQLPVLRYCCPCIMNLVARLYKYFIICGRRNQWQMWNSAAHRRSGKGHFTEIVIDFLKCGRRQGTKIETHFFWQMVHVTAQTLKRHSRKGGTGQGKETDTVLLTGAPQAKQ